jgi:acetylglutamate kinase
MPYDEKEKLIKKANILIEALPYIQRLSGKCVVIKYGGNAMLNEDLTQKILQDIVLLKYVGVNPVVVHGGGPEINKLLAQLGIEPHFHNGLRITDAQTMEVVQMVLTGKINKDITAKMNALGGKGIGLCGKDANLIEVVKKPPHGRRRSRLCRRHRQHQHEASAPAHGRRIYPDHSAYRRRQQR